MGGEEWVSIEKILNSHYRNKKLAGVLSHNIYGDLQGVSKHLKVPKVLVDYISDITYGFSWDNGLNSRTTYNTFVTSKRAVDCGQTNLNILENILTKMDSISNSKRIMPRYNVFTTSIGYTSHGSVISYERGFIEELRELKREHMNSGLSTVKLMLVYEVDKDERVQNGNISVSLIVNITKDRASKPVVLLGSVGATVYKADNIDRLIDGNLEPLLKAINLNMVKLVNMEKEQYCKVENMNGIEISLYKGDCKYY